MSVRGRIKPIVGALVSFALVAVVFAGCYPRVRHHLTVARLDWQADQQDGWHVYPMRVLDEGGGDMTWWLHPCDPAVDTERDITLTIHRRSDTDSYASWRVSTNRLECRDPSPDIELTTHSIRADTDMMLLQQDQAYSQWIPDQDVTRLALTDRIDGATRILDLEQGKRNAEGACDGTTSWIATWEERGAPINFVLRSCVGTWDSLPPELLAYLDSLDEPIDRRGNSRFYFAEVDTPYDEVGATIAHLLATAGWQPTETTNRTRRWVGPCDRFDNPPHRTTATPGRSDIALGVATCT